MIRRLNILSGPGCGKSSFAAKLYAFFKSQNYNVELCREYVKKWVYAERAPVTFDQIYILGKQLHEEFLPLKNGVEVIISDSPIFLSYYYSMEMGNSEILSESIYNIISEFDKQYPCIDIVLKRSFPYVEDGRFHSEEQSVQIDNSLKYLLQSKNRQYMEIDPSQDDSIQAVFDYFLYKKWSPLT